MKLLSALILALVLATGAGVANAAEDDPGFACRTEGNHICGTDRWVEVMQNRGGALSIERLTPRVAARRFDANRAAVCIRAIRRQGGWVEHFARGELCNR